jgi:PIN domain nuclease of toxin-antitoxin system
MHGTLHNDCAGHPHLALAQPKIALLPVTPPIAATSVGLSTHGDPADRLIAATAMTYACPLATVDWLLCELPFFARKIGIMDDRESTIFANTHDGDVAAHEAGDGPRADKDVLEKAFEAFGKTFGEVSEDALTEEIGADISIDGIISRMQYVHQKTGVPFLVLRGILTSMDETKLSEVGLSKIERLFKLKSKEYLSLQAQFTEFSSDDPKVESLWEIFWKILQRGRLSEAKDQLRLARKYIRGTQPSSRKQEVAIITALAGVAKLQPNPASYREAADLFGEAARLIAPEDTAQARKYLIRQMSTLHDLGYEFGKNDVVREGVMLCKQILSDIDYVTAPADWAITLGQLGLALRTLGEWENDTAHLVEAVAAYHEALSDYPRERDPYDRADLQNSLGITLCRLDERKPDPAWLEKASIAFREALKGYTREQYVVSFEWAGVQNNLGTALNALGERKNDPVLHREAIAAFHEALKVYTCKRTPFEWAAVKKSLGDALQRLGDLESDPVRIEEAVATYREMFEEVLIRIHTPVMWAMTQNNLGTALHRLGAHENDPARLEEAIAAHRAALAVFERGGPYARIYLEDTKRHITRAETLLRILMPSNP